MGVITRTATAPDSPGRTSRGRRSRAFLLLVCIVGFAALAIFVGWLVYHNGTYPNGVDTLAHIHKGDVLYRSILNGNLWPFYDELWYNGVEMMRYWAPLPVYVLAGCEALAGGSPTMGFVVFCSLVFFVGALSWLYVGVGVGRPWLGAGLGVLWFFMPNNLMTLFFMGNLPRSLVLSIVPVLLYWVWSFLGTGDWRRLVQIALLFALIALCHSGFAGMLAITLLVYLLVYGILNHTWRRGFRVVIALLMGYALIGVWLVPSLIGGITSQDSSQIMSGFFQSLGKSLNPFLRFSQGNINVYFGLAAFILCVFGALCAKREAIPGFVTALVILFCTSTQMYPVLSALPGGQYLWMTRFVSLALAVALFSLLVWKTLRRPLLVVLCVLLVLDALPSLPQVYGNMSGRQPEQWMAQDRERTLIDRAQEITTQRMALIDGSALDSESAYLVTDTGKPVAMSEGAAWQSASTARNFMQVDRAAQGGQFPYLFDRCLELGDDVVLVRTSFVKDYTFASQQEMDAAASSVGYSLVASNGDYRLYQLENAPESWGTVSTYEAIGIGTGAATLSLSYPEIEETTDTNLNHYSFEELSGYKTIYLSGFTYDDQAAAEDLVMRLSENGVRVIISADGIPVNGTTHDRIFLGVRCNDVNFSNGYPELDTTVGKLNCAPFPEGSENWHTVYLEGLDQSWGTFSMDSGDGQGATDLDFVGTVKNDNIVMVGLNLGYYYSLTQDPGAGQLMDRVMGMDRGTLPQREVVATQVSYAPDSITVTCDRDDVNTGLAYHDEFAAAEGVRTRNNLTYVDAGTTVLPFSYPHLSEGLAVSGVGVAGMVGLALVARRRERGRKS